MQVPYAILRVALLAAVAFSTAVAQVYVISTVAGGVPPSTPSEAIDASVGTTTGIALDSSGNVYFAATNCVFKIDHSGMLTVVAGNARQGFEGDGGPATMAALNTPIGLAVDKPGNVYIADTGNNRIRMVSTAGTITTIAGLNNSGGYSGDGGPATFALLNLNFASGVAVDSSGNVYFGDMYNHRVRRISVSGVISTVAGNGVAGFSGDGGAATAAQLNYPSGVAIDSAGNLYIADRNNTRVRMVNSEGLITTIAGTGTPGLSGDGGTALNAELAGPEGVAVDGNGNVYVTDGENSRVVREISTHGVITTAAGSESIVYSSDGVEPNADLSGPLGVAIDEFGTLFISDQYNARVVEVDGLGTVTAIAGNRTSRFSGDGGLAVDAQLDLGDCNDAVAVSVAQELYVGDCSSHLIRKVDNQGVISTVAGTYLGGANFLSIVRAIAPDPFGNLYVIGGSGQVLLFDPTGAMSVFAGQGQDDVTVEGPPVLARIIPEGLAVDASGNVYIADQQSYRIWKVTPAGVATIFAGNGSSNYSGDGGSATNAQLSPWGLAIDHSGNLFVADADNMRVRKIDASGIITTVAGNGLWGFSGDGGPATNASFASPSNVAVDPEGNLYIADSFDGRVRKVSTNGTVTTIAGNGGTLTNPPSMRDGQLGADVEIQWNNLSVAADNYGRIYFTDTTTHSVKRLTPVSSAPPFVSAVTNAASFWSAQIAPGELISLFGSSLGTAGTNVFIGGYAATLLYVSDTQINAIVPLQVWPGSVAVPIVVTHNGSASNPFYLAANPAAPGIFAISGSSGPVSRGSVVSILATGAGASNEQDAFVSIGGVQAEVTYHGGAPSLPSGVVQINVIIPALAPDGPAVPVSLSIGGDAVHGQAPTIAIQ
jgi:uncharacterized protein (TIGR03437 family)